MEWLPSLADGFAIMSKIEVLHDDPHLLIVNKPPRMLVVPAPGRRAVTLVDLLGRQVGARVYAVHRLDEDTTGVLMLARSIEAQAKLVEIFRSHRIERIYLALLTAVPVPPAGRVESYLLEDAHGVLHSASRKQGGQRAISEYRTLERRGKYALVECRLETGRRNQIRAHMAELGCPVVGDRKYGFRGGENSAIKRPLLHAFRLSLEHPYGGEPIMVECPAPEVELQL